MTARFRDRTAWLLVGVWLLAISSLPGLARQTAPPTVETNAVRQIEPAPIDNRIAFLTASMLETGHYSKKPFDEAVSSKFLDQYLDTLDPQHIHFTQGDLAEFEKYRTNLHRLTMTDKQTGDARPGCVIFNRFFERLSERTAYAEAALKKDKFEFDADERITINRKGAPYPKDLAEARQLWRQRLRYEYLQELLAKTGAAKKSESVPAKPVTPERALPEAPAPANLAARPPVRVWPQHPVLRSPKGGEEAESFLSRNTRRSATAQPDAAVTRQPPAPPTNQVAKPVVAPVTPTNTVATAAAKKSLRQEIVDTLSHRYHRNLRFFADWTNEDVLQTYLTALAHVYDPHSDYLGQAQLDQFAMSMNLGFFGIGAELTLSEEGYCTIQRLLPGGPAMKSKKIKEKDRIVAVAQGDGPPVDVIDMSLPKAVQLIRGPKGTEVRLTIIPADADASTRSVVSIIRDEIPLEDSAAKAKVIDVSDGRGGTVRVGVIDLPSFYATFDVTSSKDKPEPKSTTTDVARLLKKLEQENVSGVILDLRRNGGGSLDEAIKLAGLFIKTGPVVQVKREDGKVEQLTDTDSNVLYDGPLVVMTSRGSASASEIVAGALQDYGRALIVGDISTHGKGTVQSVNPLGQLMSLRRPATNAGALKLTIKKFYRPSGASTQLKGVTPDIVLPSVANASKDIGEKALDYALPWDEIKPAQFDHFNLVQPYLPELARRSTERVATNQEFAYIREDTARYEKQQEDKTVSLNEKARLAENRENEARAKAREKERLARPASGDKVYELTLKQVDLPGLPAPIGSTNAPVTATVPGAGLTNAAAATPIAADASAKAATREEPKAPPVDAALEEAERILLDYLTLLPKGNLVTAGH
jgi:carboxyl-terminal processing protease